ncbi:archaeosine synthase subunit alpha [Halalkalicoccus jeotgali]|uniref:tRNA-guanine transglycosylase n=1 Tax=Halalkalicoccus jeotgali (strain DSM 18796 / CECT 7217 / JCM 14584 / KCTC 4019 / B3) TaxID=795797 RepID=D8J8Z1_HALJB|nr:archaeosine synthase subunit alpha [Halalkalicoccus jeotgali]ADJ14326.1 tRNA-guanine transglycosylase, various specificities [Halalkalicoccus jeotgali B3]ELY40589.1 tRNA-guanine transglycosylase [Halalkalicoccus jeotgali B3]
MTEYFEVHGRDGAARIGELRLADPLTTPALADDHVEDAGSLWAAERDLPEGRDDRVTILPHRAFPSGTAEEVEDAFTVEHPDVEYPSGAVVSPDTAGDFGADAYVLSTAQGSVGHASALRDEIIETRRAIPADTALYLSGVATPRNAALLAYLGIDLLDSHKAVVKGTQGKYLTSDGERFLEDLEELPCACSACQRPIEAFTREDCAEHNENALRAELATVRERIRAGRLRDYVEGQARHAPWLTSLFREFDDEWGYLEERTPIYRTSEISATTDDTLRRVEIQRFADRVTSSYRNRFDNPLVLVPCSATKPYSESQSHGQFHDAIQYRAHLVSMTSPIGVVPQELETTYPAQHYDTAVTGRWTETEIAFVARVLRRYLERNEYPRVIAHLPEDYREIIERVEPHIDAEIEYTVEDHPTTTDSIANLMRTLDGELKYGKRERQHNTVKAIADYQFGEGAGEELFPDLSIQSRYPKFRAHTSDGEQLAAMVPQYGTLALTLAGARRWLDSDASTKRVAIDGFVPHGNVLAPGVLNADPEIRTGDEVVVEGPKAFAVGRAEMFGREMAESTRGVAVDVRHVEER